jgi:hypothetical protein
MTVQAQFMPRNYDVFAGLDVDKKSMAVIFTDHGRLMQSLRLPYSAAQLSCWVAPLLDCRDLNVPGPEAFGNVDISPGMTLDCKLTVLYEYHETRDYTVSTTAQFWSVTHDSGSRQERMLYRKKVAAARIIIIHELALSNHGFNLLLG